MASFQVGGSEEPSARSTPKADYASSALDSDDDLSTLPYPSELPRSDFLAADFDPQAYLSSLRNRHQTLEDLRSDLRQRVQMLNRELLDLVNGNYEEFLSLGSDLKGGGEKVEGVRVGVLSFQREVEGVRKAVALQCTEAGRLLAERKAIKADVMKGRACLEISESIEVLEESLGIKEVDEDDEQEDDDYDYDDDETNANGLPSNGTAAKIKKLRRHCDTYILIDRRIKRIGEDNLFLATQQSRLAIVKRTLLLDLSAAIREAKSSKQADSILALLQMYSDLDAGVEGLRVLKAG